MLGEHRDRHPDFERFLDEYIAKENGAITKYNQSVDSMDYRDLFEWSVFLFIYLYLLLMNMLSLFHILI